MRIFSRFKPLSVVLSLLIFSDAFAKPEPLAAAFQKPKGTKSKGKAAPVQPVPGEYNIYFQGKAALKGKSTPASIEVVEKEILLSRLHSETKTLDRELEELFYALELKRGTLFAQKKSWAPALASYHRGLNGLAPFKWIYYWHEEDSKSLAKVCTRNKKVKDEICLTLAKRVSDTFPKAALETKTLRDLPVIDNAPVAEVTGDRLSQTYSEKTENDEEAFKEVLENYQEGRDSELLKTVQKFNQEFPRSGLRFRANFLVAENYTKRNSKNLAAPLYQSLIDETPLSFYAIVASERLGVNLSERVKKDPVVFDSANFNPTLFEKMTLERAKALFAKQHYDEVGYELDALTRIRSYSTDFLFYLMRFGYDSNQNLFTFKCASELIQRKFDGFLNAEMLQMIFPDRFVKEIDSQARLNKIDPLLVASLMKQESGYKAPVISASGAMGLMQLMPFTAVDTKKDVVLSTLKDPEINIAIGTKYLAALLDKYDGNIPFALAAYNAGPHRVAKWRKEAKPDVTKLDWIEAIPFKETREYVMSILRNRYWYQYRRGMVPDKVALNEKMTLPEKTSSVDKLPPSPTPGVEKPVAPSMTPVNSL